MIVWGLDPGTRESGVVMLDLWDGVIDGYIDANEAIEKWFSIGYVEAHYVAIERIRAQGRVTVGNETFDAIEWQTKFECAALAAGLTVRMIPRHEVRMHFGGAKANDASIRRLLIARWGGKLQAIGTKKAPGPLYGLKSHMWQALAVAVTYYDQLELERKLEVTP